MGLQITDMLDITENKCDCCKLNKSRSEINLVERRVLFNLCTQKEFSHCKMSTARRGLRIGWQTNSTLIKFVNG